MPNFGQSLTSQTAAPVSTPQLLLENNYRQLQDWGRRQERELRSLGLDYDTLADRMQRLQIEYDKKRADIETKMNTVQQIQHWMDLGIIDQSAADKLKFKAVLPEEVTNIMFPESKPAKLGREPFTPGQLENFQPRIKAFAEAAEVKVPWGRDKPPTFERLLKQYKAWQTSIGYNALTNTEQEQVDKEWDDWVKVTYPETAWYPQARKEIRALRAKGPISRSVTARFRQTPIGPKEMGSPLKDNIVANLPKKKQPEILAQPKPTELSDEDRQAIAWARQNPGDPRAVKILTLHGVR